MKFILLISSLLIVISLTNCKAKPKVKDVEYTQEGENKQELDTPLGLVQKDINLKAIEGKKLYWVQTLYNDDSKSISETKRAYIILQAKGQMQVQSICNMGAGTYKLNQKAIEIRANMTTKIACKEPTVEYKYFQDLRSATLAFQVGNKIFFDLKGHTGTMEFEIRD